MDLNKSCKQSNNDLTPPTTDTRQMVRATASSPFDKPHLRTLSIEESSTSETKSDGQTSTKGIHSRKLGRNPTINESDENTRTLIHQHKKLTASKDRTPNCCTDAASTQTFDSIQYATSETTTECISQSLTTAS
jgi:hypothetical protein